MLIIGSCIIEFDKLFVDESNFHRIRIKKMVFLSVMPYMASMIIHMNVNRDKLF
jgi:hypothetical protein